MKKNSLFRKIIAWVPAVLWMGFIFMMSAAPGEVSSEQSGKITEIIVTVLSAITPQDAPLPAPDLLHTLVRKLAHMTEYAILFLLDRHALRVCGARRPGLTALLLCIGYAASDEGHQAFVDDRGPSVIDVGIDTLGACLAWGVAALARKCDIIVNLPWYRGGSLSK